MRFIFYFLLWVAIVIFSGASLMHTSVGSRFIRTLFYYTGVNKTETTLTVQRIHGESVRREASDLSSHADQALDVLMMRQGQRQDSDETPLSNIDQPTVRRNDAVTDAPRMNKAAEEIFKDNLERLRDKQQRLRDRQKGSLIEQKDVKTLSEKTDAVRQRLDSAEERATAQRERMMAQKERLDSRVDR